MGNFLFGSSKLSINLEQEVFQAGQPLTGTVVLQVKRPLQFGALSLHIQGKEKVRAGSTRNAYTKRAERQFFTVDLPLKAFTTKVQRGTYSFPFTVDLPASLPSSTKYPADASDSAAGFRIQYKMAARIANLRDERHILIASAPLPDEHVQCLVEPTSFSLKTAGLFKKGTVSMGASITDSHVGRGESLDLHIACRNESTADIRRVEIKLVEHLHWETASSPTSVGQSGVAKDVSELLVSMKDVDLPSLDKVRRSRIDVRNSKSNPMVQSTNYQEIFDELVSGRSCITLIVPVNARDSYKGQIIQISHYLEIKLQTGSMINNPVTKIPIRIGNRAVPSSPASVMQPPDASPPFAPLEDSVVPEPEIPVPIPMAPTDDEIPIVTAVSIPDDAIQASMTIASADVITLGGDAVVQAHDSLDLSDLVPVPPPRDDDLPRICLPRLLREMSRSINDYDLLMEKLDDSEWSQLVTSLSPEDYGSIVSNVTNEFDQPRVAALLTPYLNGGGNFTCEYAAAAVRKASEWNRSSVAQRLLPLCVDVETHYHMIRNELNEWDQTVTENDFQDAIGNAKGNYR